MNSELCPADVPMKPNILFTGDKSESTMVFTVTASLTRDRKCKGNIDCLSGIWG